MLQELSIVRRVTELQGRTPGPGTPDAPGRLGSGPETGRLDVSLDLTAEITEVTDLIAETADTVVGTGLGGHRRGLYLPEIGGTDLLFQAGGSTHQVRLLEWVLVTDPGEPGLEGETILRRVGTK